MLAQTYCTVQYTYCSSQDVKNNAGVEVGTYHEWYLQLLQAYGSTQAASVFAEEPKLYTNYKVFRWTEEQEFLLVATPKFMQA